MSMLRQCERIDFRASGKAATLIVAKIGAGGTLTVEASGATSTGARNPVVDGAGAVYLADAPAAQVAKIVQR